MTGAPTRLWQVLALALFLPLHVVLMGIDACTSTTDADSDGYTAEGGDCDDNDPGVHPGAAESCDGKDNDCNTQIDDATVIWYRDADNDGYGLVTAPVTASCEVPPGYVADYTDCDDTDASVHPAATEVCNGIDDDCDQTADEGVTTVFYRDADNDGYGALASGTIEACTAPAGYAAEDNDCDDTRSTVHPGAAETCNTLDDDCDNAIDEDVTSTFYRDVDGDGYGSSSSGTVTACTAPSGYVANSTDCDDTVAAIHPGAAESCNGVDDNCSGVVDEGVTTLYYRDVDGDGYGSSGSGTATACTAPAGYVSKGTDCDDAQPAVYPGAIETCNSVDDNCNGTVDEGVKTTWYKDNDGDGYGSSASGSTQACTQPAGYVADKTDCNDANAAVYPGAAEACDGLDNNCNGTIDEVIPTWYRDIDGDTYGATASGKVTSCTQPSGYVGNNLDCNDSNAAIHPGAAETCNSIDDNCDAQVDEGVKNTYYKDADGDTYGLATSGTTQACTAPTGYVSNNLDCDDTKSSVRPGATETCNGIDDDCDTSIDENVQVTYYKDNDRDGYGSAASGTTQACSTPSGYVTNNTDCDDTNAAVKPGATETCNGIDDDCDASIDENVTTTYYKDNDLDTFGATASGSTRACAQPTGYAKSNTDCNDSDPAVYPGAVETCNGIDDDCDAAVDETAPTWYLDADGDGYGTSATSVVACTAPAGYVSNKTDCNDADPAVNPGMSEACNGIDDNCNGKVDDAVGPIWYRDADLDTYGTAVVTSQSCVQPSGYVSNSLDCNDNSATVRPGQLEICNGVDDNCSGQVDEGTTPDLTFYRDVDGDGFGAAGSGVTMACAPPTGYATTDTDCNDAVASIYPGATDVAGDGIDASCDHKDGNEAYYSDLDITGYPTRIDTTISYEYLGTGVAGGDFDGDGEVDLAVGAGGDDTGGSDAGAVFVMSGPLFGHMDVVTATAKLVGEQAGNKAGYAMTAADLNGDGYDDVVIGVPAYSLSGSTIGAVYAFFGPISGTLNLAFADLKLLGEASSSATGAAVASAGDVNLDGYDDLLIGAPGTSVTSTGSAYLVLGSSTLFGTINLSNARAKWTGATGNRAGSAVGGAGDVNGDGYPDLLIGANGFNYSQGAAYLVLGSKTLAGTFALSSSSSYRAMFTGEATGDTAGSAVSGAGDVNGDGFDDLLIGAPANSTNRGVVYLVSGSASLSGTVALAGATSRITGATTNCALGKALCTLGDMNRDGFEDFLLGDRDYSSGGNASEGAVYVFFGPVSGTVSAAASDVELKGTVATLLGASIAALGDVNFDGFPDLAAAGDYHYNGDFIEDAGAAWVMFGPLRPNKVLAKAQPRFLGEAAADAAGLVLGGDTDVNGDGLDDLLIGAPLNDSSTLTNNGVAYLVHGSTLAGGDVNLSASAARLTGEGAGDRAGSAVAGLGDLNGDGYGDFLVGSHLNDGAGADAGAAYLFLGPVSGTKSLATAKAKLTGEKAGDYAGYALHAAGDLDADGEPDVLVSAPQADTDGKTDNGVVYLFSGISGLSGTVSLSTAKAKLVGENSYDLAGSTLATGDVNGDGWRDLVVGAPKGDITSGTDAGATYLVFGPITGTIALSSTSAVKITGAAAYEYLGTGLAAGDINRDGYADLAIGSPGYSSGTGKVMFVPGSGTLKTGSLGTVTTLTSGTGNGLGSVVAVRDLSGDRAVEVFVGEAKYDLTGRVDAGVVWMLKGGSMPKTATLSLSGSSQNAAVFSGLAAGDAAGTAVASPGDVDGDGYPDLLIGATGYDRGSTTDTGAAYLLYWGR